MTVLSSDTRTALIAKKADLESSLEAAYETLDKLIAGTADKYRFDSGEGSQSVTKRSMDDQLKVIDWLESRIDAIDRRLRGLGVVRMNVRRKFGRAIGKYGVRPY